MLCTWYMEKAEDENYSGDTVLAWFQVSLVTSALTFEEKYKKHPRDFPGNPVIMTPSFHSRGLCSIPGQGTKIFFKKRNTLKETYLGSYIGTVRTRRQLGNPQDTFLSEMFTRNIVHLFCLPDPLTMERIIVSSLLWLVGSLKPNL